MNRRRKSCYRPYEGKRWPLWRKAVLALLLAGALAFGALFGAVMYGAYDHIQGEPRLMVILGCQVKPWGPSILLQDRLDKALDYLEEHPDVQVVVSGGQGPGEPTTEAQAMYDYLTEHGVEPERIWQEPRAESTRENLQFSLALIEEKTGRRPREIAVVSSEYHLFRASCMARSQGVSMLGVPAATYPPALRVHYAFREIFGLWLFLLLGR